LIPAVDWTGISVGSRASVDLLAKRKIPAPALNKSFDFQSVTSYLTDEGIKVLTVLKKGYKNAFPIQ
jgi:hypothetical protein